MMENAEKDWEVDDLFEVGLQVLLGVSFEDQNLKIYELGESEGQTDGSDRWPARHNRKNRNGQKQLDL